MRGRSHGGDYCWESEKKGTRKGLFINFLGLKKRRQSGQSQMRGERRKRKRVKRDIQRAGSHGKERGLAGKAGEVPSPNYRR